MVVSKYTGDEIIVRVTYLKGAGPASRQILLEDLEHLALPRPPMDRIKISKGSVEFSWSTYSEVFLELMKRKLGSDEQKHVDVSKLEFKAISKIELRAPNEYYSVVYNPYTLPNPSFYKSPGQSSLLRPLTSQVQPSSGLAVSSTSLPTPAKTLVSGELARQYPITATLAGTKRKAGFEDGEGANKKPSSAIFRSVPRAISATSNTCPTTFAIPASTDRANKVPLKLPLKSPDLQISRAESSQEGSEELRKKVGDVLQQLERRRRLAENERKKAEEALRDSEEARRLAEEGWKKTREELLLESEALRRAAEEGRKAAEDVLRVLEEGKALAEQERRKLEDALRESEETRRLAEAERVRAVEALQDLQREMKDPFVVPALLEAFALVSDLTDRVLEQSSS